MSDIAREVTPINIEDELRQSYLDYAMSVIVGRALPDVRDGLKPVHRRVLFAMKMLGNDWNKAYKKSARVVGDVIGKYHPHGDTAAYDTIVRMAQPFSMRYPLVDGQGNFGSVDGDSAAAMRYTEVRMTKMAHRLLADIDKETVDWVPNYDGSEQIPDVLPTRVPNLLVNGASGIAVGMATNIPPHNLNEVVDASLALLDNAELTTEDIMAIIPAPDFPTAGIIHGRAGVVDAYRTGKGKVYIRSRAEVEDWGDKDAIIVTELPYQVNKARLIEKIAELVKDGKLEGISEIRDESDKDGMRVVIECRGDRSKSGRVSGEVILNNLYHQTRMEEVFSINMVALHGGQPKTFTLKGMLEAFVAHRREVVTRRTIFDLRKAKEKGHLLEGLAVALASIDPVIETIKKSPSSAEAKAALMARDWPAASVVSMVQAANAESCRPDDLDKEFGVQGDIYRMSPAQAQAILDMRLNKLTGMEQDNLLKDYKEILALIGELGLILADPDRLTEVVREELEAVKEAHGDERRSEIVASRRDMAIEDLIDEQELVVTLSHEGYIKRQPLDAYQAQHRGGRGKSASGLKAEDFIEHLMVVNSHATLMLFSTKGKVYWLKGFDIPEASRTARGLPVINLLKLDEDESITTIMPVKDYDQEAYIFMATQKGTVKKTPLEAFKNQRSLGLIALSLDEDDQLIGAKLTTGADHIMLVSSEGKAVRFNEIDVRAMGRTARGVRGIRLSDQGTVVSMMVMRDDADVLTLSENGFGKRSKAGDFPLRGRGGQGVIAMQCTDRNGAIAGASLVSDLDEVMLITTNGTLVRTPVGEIPSLGRNTQGVKVIRLGGEETLCSVSRIDESLISDEESASEEETVSPDSSDEGEA